MIEIFSCVYSAAMEPLTEARQRQQNMSKGQSNAFPDDLLLKFAQRSSGKRVLGLLCLEHKPVTSVNSVACFACGRDEADQVCITASGEVLVQ